MLAGLIRSLPDFTAVLVSVWCAALPAHAADSCEDPLQGRHGQSLTEWLATARDLEPGCHKNPSFLYEFGRALNLTAQYDEAIDKLEGALLHRPEHWPTQLEYAIALEGVGDHESSIGLVHSLLQNPDVDSETLRQLTALTSAKPQAHLQQRQTVIGLATGYDDNLLGSTYHTQLSLTTPLGLLPVELAQDQRPQAGSFVRADLTHEGTLTASTDASWQFTLTGNYRYSPQVASAELGQWGATLERSSTGGGWYAVGQHQTLLRADAPVVRQNLIGIGYDYLPNTANAARTCSQRISVELQNLVYPASETTNGNYHGIAYVGRCAQYGTQWQLRAGTDHPENTLRPGGSQTQYSLKATRRTAVSDALLTMELEATHQQDQSGYSILLDNGAPRTIRRFVYRFDYRWRAGTTSPYIAYEWLDQRSNLPLFELNNRVFTLGVRTSW